MLGRLVLITGIVVAASPAGCKRSDEVPNAAPAPEAEQEAPPATPRAMAGTDDERPAGEPVAAQEGEASGDEAEAGEAPEATEQAPGSDQPEPAQKLDPEAAERKLLSAYREIYCLQKKNNQVGVIGVWERHGYDAASWAEAVQEAARRAEEDPKGFGKRWTSIADKPCP